MPYSLPLPAARRNSYTLQSGQCVTPSPELSPGPAACLHIGPTASQLCQPLSAFSPDSLPQPSDLHCLFLSSPGLLLGPLSDLSILLTSFISFSSLLMCHLPREAVPACLLTAKCNATPTYQLPLPSVSLRVSMAPSAAAQDTLPLFVLLIICLPSWALHSTQEEML